MEYTFKNIILLFLFLHPLMSHDKMEKKKRVIKGSEVIKQRQHIQALTLPYQF